LYEYGDSEPGGIGVVGSGIESWGLVVVVVVVFVASCGEEVSD
jgi:hypothetical protein